MSASIISKTFAALLCLSLFAVGTARAQSPTSLAENSDEYNAYVYSYLSWVYSSSIADSISPNTSTGEVAQLVDDYTYDGFMHCYDALVDDDDSSWSQAVYDLEMARMWCNTLIVFADGSESSSTIYNIETLMDYLDIAISRAKAAAPSRGLLVRPVVGGPFLPKK